MLFPEEFLKNNNQMAMKITERKKNGKGETPYIIQTASEHDKAKQVEVSGIIFFNYLWRIKWFLIIIIRNVIYVPP